MGQKINPVALRMHQNRTFDASWYNDHFITSFKTEQYFRKALVSFFQILSQSISNQYLGRVFFQKSHKKTIVTFFFFKRRTRRQARKNRFLFKFSNANFQQIQEKKNYGSFLKSRQFNPSDNTEFTYQNQLNPVFSTINTGSLMNPFELSQMQMKSFTGYSKNMLLGENKKQYNFEYNKLFRLTFHCLLYIAFLRKRTKKETIRLYYLLAFLKIPFTINSKDLQKQSAISIKEDFSKKTKDIIIHPFLRVFEQGLGSFSFSNVYLRPILCRKLNQSAIFIAEQIVQILQKNQKKKKMPGHLIKKILRPSQFDSSVGVSESSMGIRVLCSGRLAGAEMARKFFLKKGQTSLNVFSQKIDFAQRIAQTKYGVIGVKVWVSYLK